MIRADLKAALAVVALLSVAVSYPAAARPQNRERVPDPVLMHAPGGDAPGTDPLYLLEFNEQVQQNLGLDETQIRRIREIARKTRTRMQDLSAGLLTPQAGRDLQGEEAARQEMMARQIQMAKGEIGRVLQPWQLARFREIALQIGGTCAAAADREAADELAITTAQAARLEGICRQMMERIRDAVQPLPEGDVQARRAAALPDRERIERIRRDGEAQALAVLSDEQRQQFARMQGERLALDPDRAPGGRR